MAQAVPSTLPEPADLLRDGESPSTATSLNPTEYEQNYSNTLGLQLDNAASSSNLYCGSLAAPEQTTEAIPGLALMEASNEGDEERKDTATPDGRSAGAQFSLVPNQGSTGQTNDLCLNAVMGNSGHVSGNVSAGII